MWFQKIPWNPQKPFMTSYPPQKKNPLSIIHTFLVILMKGLSYWLYAEAGWNLASCSTPCTTIKDLVSLIFEQKNILLYRTGRKRHKVRRDPSKHVFALFLSLSYTRVCHNISGLLPYTHPPPFPTLLSVKKQSRWARGNQITWEKWAQGASQLTDCWSSSSGNSG